KPNSALRPFQKSPDWSNTPSHALVGSPYSWETDASRQTRTTAQARTTGPGCAPADTRSVSSEMIPGIPEPLTSRCHRIRADPDHRTSHGGRHVPIANDSTGRKSEPR